MTRLRYISPVPLLALPAQVFAQGAPFVLRLQQPVEGKPIAAEPICSANISSAQCLRASAGSGLAIQRNTDLTGNPIPNAPYASEKFVVKPAPRSGRGTGPMLEYITAAQPRAGDWVVVDHVAKKYDAKTLPLADSETACVLPDPSAFQYTLDAPSKTLIFTMPCPLMQQQLQLRDSASGNLVLPVLVPRADDPAKAPRSFKLVMCGADFTATNFALYVGQTANGLSYPLTPTGKQSAATSCTQPAVANGEDAVAARFVTQLRPVNPIANAFQSSSPAGRLLAFSPAPASPPAPAPAAPPPPDSSVTLTRVDPPNGAVGATVSATLTGTGFTGDSTVKAGSNITVSNIAVVSATSITANFAIAAKAATGPVDVTVTTKAGTSALPAKLFTVNPAPPPAQPDTALQVTEGSTVVTGYYTTSSPPKSVTAEVRAGDSSASAVIEVVTGITIGTDGKFSINLTQPLAVEPKNRS